MKFRGNLRARHAASMARAQPSGRSPGRTSPDAVAIAPNYRSNRNPGRQAADDSERNVFENDGPGRHDRIGSDGRLGHHDRTVPDKAVDESVQLSPMHT